MTSDGERIGQEEYKNIVYERFLISKHLHTSYDGTLNITPIERTFLIQFIKEDLEMQKQLIDQQKNNNGR